MKPWIWALVGVLLITWLAALCLWPRHTPPPPPEPPREARLTWNDRMALGRPHPWVSYLVQHEWYTRAETFPPQYDWRGAALAMGGVRGPMVGVQAYFPERAPCEAMAEAFNTRLRQSWTRERVPAPGSTTRLGQPVGLPGLHPRHGTTRFEVWGPSARWVQEDWHPIYGAMGLTYRTMYVLCLPVEDGPT